MALRSKVKHMSLVSSLGANADSYLFYMRTKGEVTLIQLQYYRKVVYKSRGLCAIFQFFSAAFIQVRHMQCSESAKRVEAVWHMYSERATLRNKTLSHGKKWNAQSILHAKSSGRI